MTRDEFTAHLELHGWQLQKWTLHFQIVRGNIALVSSVFDNGPWEARDVWAPGAPAEWSAISDEMLAGCIALVQEWTR